MDAYGDVGKMEEEVAFVFIGLVGMGWDGLYMHGLALWGSIAGCNVYIDC